MNGEVVTYEDEFLIFSVTGITMEIRRHIFNTYFAKEIRARRMYAKVINVLESVECQQLNARTLIPYIDKILADNVNISYFRLREVIFDNLYDKECVKNERHFKLMDRSSSIACAWIFYLYH